MLGQTSPSSFFSSNPAYTPADTFVRRHIGPDESEVASMLCAIGQESQSLEELITQVVPADIRLSRPLDLPSPQGEHETLAELRAIAGKNRLFRSFIGMGYSDTITPPVIQRNILENPGWYTAYTPYQAEISQGRMEALLNFQTMVSDLTGMDIANASLLDEATAAAEAMHMACSLSKNADDGVFFVSRHCHPQTIAVVRTRARALGIEIIVGDEAEYDFAAKTFGVLLQYPHTDGALVNPAPFIAKAREHGAIATVAADILALALIQSPGELGADIAVGSTQRFGVPLGYGGPHAAYFATRDAYKRSMPGRLIGVSRDSQGNAACRLALQTREQHIRRDKATSNICTAQALLAIMASMYAVYHGPAGLRRIAERVHLFARTLAEGLKRRGVGIAHEAYFDTLRITLPAGTTAADILARAEARGINLRPLDAQSVGISLNETTNDLADLFAIFSEADLPPGEALPSPGLDNLGGLERQSGYLAHPVFNTHHTETEMLRYIRRLEAKDLSLTTSMISLGSCTMKLNATTQMLPVTWPEFGNIHPFAPAEQAAGYAELFRQLEAWLAEITGFAAVSLQPNAGSAGEYAGLLAIRAYHESRGESGRTICLIPQSAHGTNPASAVMAGFKVVPVKCTSEGNVDVEDLRARAREHEADLGALMITYPSTHGVFEASIREVCEIIHAHGGQVYMDGANMNAQVGLTSPGFIGADVCHLNLHKTFCIPHGGGGPGMGPIGVAKHLVPFLPAHPLSEANDSVGQVGPVAAAPWGSASILVIPWAYIRMMGAEGLTEASRIAILNANYIAHRLHPYFPVVYRGASGLVAHECIVDIRPLKARAGVEVEDVAKRLIDYGFHAPTMSWPVVGTLMVEPTESESKGEIDRFCDAMIAIHAEAAAIESGALDKKDNPLKNAPHTALMATADTWEHPYGRQQAAFPAPWSREHKYWPPVGRVDNVYGDRNLVCSCVGMEAYAE